MTTPPLKVAASDQMLRAIDVPCTSGAPHALYLHIPFCHHRCAYCDFNIYADQPALHEAYVQAVAAELACVARHAGRVRVPTIYIGGGTPSILPAELIGALLTAVRTFCDVAAGAEITLEVNPLTSNRNALASTVHQPAAVAYFAQLHALGVNRLSLGVQSSQADELALLRRGHTFDEAVSTYHAAREAGLANINLDLIYGLPDQPPARWRETLRRVIALQPEHISAYSLQVEERTALFNWVRDGKVPEPQDAVVAEMYEETQALLAAAGFEHYEISNWAKAGAPGNDYRSQHNLVYWRNEPYFGLGCGAHSAVAGQRYWNVLTPRDYVRAIDARGEAVAGRETISRELEIGETLMLGLRLIDEGVDRARFADRFGVALTDVYGAVIAQLVDQNLLEARADRIRLTARGRLLGNRVFAEFLPEVA